MDIDEQLAALAAGELDDDTARALRARVATDPAIARRLARHRQLQGLLEGWEVSAMSDEAVARLDARMEEALAALDDGPLADERVVPLTPRPLAAESDADVPAGGGTAAGDSQVVDLGAERRRRGLPSWVPGAAVAAALIAVVGTGVVLGGLPGSADLDTLAEDSADEATDDAVQEEAADGPAGAEMFDDDAAGSLGGALGPVRQSGIELAEGELLDLVEAHLSEAMQAQSNALTSGDTNSDTDTADGGDDPADDSGEAAPEAAITGAAPADAQCVTEALERDTEQVDGREVWLVGTGTYTGEPAVFVIIRTPAASEDRLEVLAYDPADCSLLERDETTT